MSIYSIHRGLGELKLLDSKINKATVSSTKYVGYKKNSADGENATLLTEEKFEAMVKSNLDSVMALIERRKEIKEAIVNSNARTEVTIGKKKYTVASAIERKSSIQYEKNLLMTLKRQYEEAVSQVTLKNDSMEMKLDIQVSQMLGGEKNAKNNDNIANFSEMYRNQNGWKVCDPLNISNVIKVMEREIEEFETEVDYVLSTSNAITEIEISE